jgi:hypothetical protein
MSSFNDIITANGEGLLQKFNPFQEDTSSLNTRLTKIAKHFQLHPQQMVCAVGFNPNARYIIDIFPILGFATYNELI